MPLRLYFIRHGETEWSRSGQYTGRADIPLTAHGEDEAQELGLRIRGIPFARVLTSPLKRAQQTCAPPGGLGCPSHRRSISYSTPRRSVFSVMSTTAPANLRSLCGTLPRWKG